MPDHWLHITERSVMYLSYYNLSAKPFQISTDSHFLWLGSDHKEALAHLRFGLLENNGYAVLIGDVGTGKTTLINALLQMLDKNFLVAAINHPTLDSDQFLSFVLRAYDPAATFSNKADFLHHLREFLQHAHAKGKKAVLIVDESHHLSETLLEEIRLLSNMEQDGEKLINIIFAGQPELKRKLQSSYCKALRQRITLFYHLQPLSRTDTIHYIDHRLELAGAKEQLFTAESVYTIHKYSRGIPRLINKICDRALLTGYVKDKKQIDAAIISECAREISLIDPVISAFPSIQPILPTARYFFSGLKRMWATGRVLFASFGTAASVEAIAVGKTLHSYWEHNRKVLFAISAAAVLLVAGWLFNGHWNQNARPVARTTAKLTQTWEESTPAGYLPDDANRSHGREELSHSSSAQPAALLPSATPSAPQTPSVTSAPKVPSMTEIASGMLAKQDYQKVIAMLETQSRPPADDVGTLYARALVGRAGQIMNESPKEAEDLLRKAIQADSNSFDAFVHLGNLYTRTQRYSESVDVYRKALQLNPQHTDVLFNLGFTLANTGMYESAEEMLARVVQLKPEYIDKALFNLAVVQQKVGKIKESLASLEAAVAIRPQNEKAQAFLKELRSAEKEH